MGEPEKRATRLVAAAVEKMATHLTESAFCRYAATNAIGHKPEGSISSDDMLAQLRKIHQDLCPPAPTAIKVGSFLRFCDAVERKTGTHLAQAPHLEWGAFAGLPVEVSHLVPANMVVVMAGDKIEAIIRFDDD